MDIQAQAYAVVQPREIAKGFQPVYGQVWMQGGKPPARRDPSRIVMRTKHLDDELRV
jgi:hypothetical protein